MDQYHLFFDADGRAIVIANDPAAMDAAPYDCMERRYSSRSVDAAFADHALRKLGGIAVYGEGEVVRITAAT